MAEQQAILGTGQSQGARVGELTKFEDKAPETSPRNPAVFPRTPLVSRAFQQDKFTLPGVWPDRYKEFSLRGRATPAVLRLAPFNPTSTYYEQQDVGASTPYGGHITSTYPGYARAQGQGVPSRVRILLEAAFQADPVGLKITRVSTGTQHTIAAGWSNANPGVVTVTEPLDPPLSTGETFKLPLQVTATGTASRIPSNVRFGGYHDGGSMFEAAYGGGSGVATPVVLGGFTVQPYPALFPVATTGAPLPITVRTRYFRPGQRVRFTFTGAPHPDLVASAVDYYVTRVDFSNATAPQIYISTSRFGDEVTYGGTPFIGAGYISQLPQHVDSTMAGCRVRWLSGVMEGQVYDLDDNEEVAAAPTNDFHLKTITAMAATPQAGDTFEIVPQQVNGEDVDWDEFAHFVPECYLDGRAYGQPFPLVASHAAVSPGSPVVFTMTANSVYEGMRFRMFNHYLLPGAVETSAPTSGAFTGAGQLLYAVNVNYALNTCNVATTYGGNPISDATLSAGFVNVVAEEHPDRANTAPPGFNFDNARATPDAYQPYFGSTPSITTPEKGACYLTSLAVLLHQKLGTPIHVLHTNVSGTSLSRREAAVSSSAGFAHSWFDSQVMLDWSPNGEPDSCYARMVKTMEMGKRAALARGDTLKLLGVWNAQGETDAALSRFLAAYPDNLRALVAAVRAKAVELGLWDGPAETLPWWQPKVPTTKGADWGLNNYENNKALNAAIDEVAAEDPYFVTREVEDAVISYDTVHYSGDYLHTLGVHAFNDWESVASFTGDRTRLDICNQALKNVGETREIVSLTENTTAARLCNRYYPIALRTLLEMFPWPEATERAELTKLASNPRETIDWQYAYRLPVNFRSVVGLGADPAGAYVADESEYTIEGTTLYTNLSSVSLRYTTIAPNPERYSQHFTNALTHQLAAEIAPGLAQGDKGEALARAQLQKAAYFVDQAKEHVTMRQRHAEDEDTRYAWD